MRSILHLSQTGHQDGYRRVVSRLASWPTQPRSRSHQLLHSTASEASGVIARQRSLAAAPVSAIGFGTHPAGTVAASVGRAALTHGVPRTVIDLELVERLDVEGAPHVEVLPVACRYGVISRVMTDHVSTLIPSMFGEGAAVKIEGAYPLLGSLPRYKDEPVSVVPAQQHADTAQSSRLRFASSLLGE